MHRFASLVVGVVTVASLAGCSSSIDEAGTGGSGSDDDGPVTANATAAIGATSTTGVGAGTNGPCGGIAPLTTARGLASTPRADTDAEVLAVEASGDFVASDALYARVHEELEAIRALAPDLADITPRSQLVPALIFMQVDDATAAALAAGEPTAAACLSALYGAKSFGQKGDPFLPNHAYADFGAKVLDSIALAEQFEGLAGVLSASAQGYDIDGSDVCLHAEGDAHLYIFDRAGGDCPAGCTEHALSGFRVMPDEAPERLGDFDPYLDVEPTWFTAATRCKALL